MAGCTNSRFATGSLARLSLEATLDPERELGSNVLQKLHDDSGLDKRRTWDLKRSVQKPQRLRCRPIVRTCSSARALRGQSAKGCFNCSGRLSAISGSTQNAPHSQPPSSNPRGPSIHEGMLKGFHLEAVFS